MPDTCASRFLLDAGIRSRYIYNSDYFEETREMQVYLSGVDGSLKSDSLLAIYVLDAQYPPTFNLFCSTFELTHPNIPCIIVGIFNSNRQSELTPPFTDSLSVKDMTTRDMERNALVINE